MCDSHLNDLMRRNFGNIFSFKNNGTFFCGKKSGKSLQCSGFSCTVGTDQGDDLSLVYLKGNSFQSLNYTIIYV